MKFGDAIPLFIVALSLLEPYRAQSVPPKESVSKLPQNASAAQIEKQVLQEPFNQTTSTTAPAQNASASLNAEKLREKPTHDAADVQNETSTDDKLIPISIEEITHVNTMMPEMMSDVKEPVFVADVGEKEQIFAHQRVSLDLSQIRGFNLAAQAIANNPYLALNFIQTVARAQKKLKSGLMDYLAQGGLKKANNIFIISKSKK